MANLGSLSWTLTADSTRFQTAMSKAKRNLQTLGKAAGILAGAGGALALLVNRAIDVADQLGKMSQKTGVAVETLQGWRLAAERAGASTEAMDKSLLTFNKRLGEARQGQGALNSFLKEFNPTLLENLVNAENTAEAYRLMAESISQTENAADRAKLASAAFSKTIAQQVLLALGEGAEGLDKFTQQLRDAGLVMTEEMTKDAAIARDAIDDLLLTLNAGRNITLVRFADELASIADFLRERIPDAVKFVRREFLLFQVQLLEAAITYNRTFGDLRRLAPLRQQQVDVANQIFRLNNPQQSSESPAAEQKRTTEEVVKQTAVLERQEQLTVQLINGVRTITNIPARAG